VGESTRSAGFRGGRLRTGEADGEGRAGEAWRDGAAALGGAGWRSPPTRNPSKQERRQLGREEKDKATRIAPNGADSLSRLAGQGATCARCLLLRGGGRPGRGGAWNVRTAWARCLGAACCCVAWRRPAGAGRGGGRRERRCGRSEGRGGGRAAWGAGRKREQRGLGSGLGVTHARLGRSAAPFTSRWHSVNNSKMGAITSTWPPSVRRVSFRLTALRNYLRANK
jgi:hypothetical protein